MILLRNTQRVLDSKEYVGKNMFDKATATNGFFVDKDTGDLVAHALFFASDYIKVLPSTFYIKNVSGNTAFYDINKSYLSGDNLVQTTTPANAYYLRTGTQITGKGTFQLELGSVATPYSPYSPSALNALSLVDRSRWGNNGTFSNVTWVQLPTGVWVMNFNGADSYVEIADSPTMRMAGGGTIEVWAYLRTAGEGGYSRIIDKSSDATGADGYKLQFNTNNVIYFKTSTGADLLSSNNALPFNVFKHIIITLGSSRKIYVNATDVTASGGSETSLPPNVAGATRVGNRAGATDFTLDGYIGGLKLHSKALTQAEITRRFTAQRSLYGV